MEDKLSLPLDELIKKQREEKKKSGHGKKKGFKNDQPKKGNFRNQKMKQRTGFLDAPSARDKARMLRRNKVNRFGSSRGEEVPFRNGKVFTTKGREGRSNRDDWKENKPKKESRGPKLTNRLKVSNLNNVISNEDLNVLFRNIGPLKE